MVLLLWPWSIFFYQDINKLTFSFFGLEQTLMYICNTEVKKRDIEIRFP